METTETQSNVPEFTIPSQPAAVVQPEQQKDHTSAPYIVLGVVVLSIVSAFSYYLGTIPKKSADNEVVESITPTPTATATLTPTVTVTPTVTATPTASLIPKATVAPLKTYSVKLAKYTYSGVPSDLYFATRNNEEGVFFTSELTRTYYTPGAVETYDINHGEFYSINDWGESELTNKDVSNLVSIGKFPFTMLVGDLSYANDNKNVVYILMFKDAVESKKIPALSSIYKITKGATIKTEEIWQNGVENQSRYPEHKSDSSIVASDTRYLAISTWSCEGCDGGEVAGVAIFNIATKKEVYYGRIGNIKFIEDVQQFSYQKLARVSKACSVDGPGCDNGKMIVDEPQGETFYGELP